MTRFEEAEIMRCIPAAPVPINWQPGDWAWDGQFLMLIRSSTGVGRVNATPFGLYTTIHYNLTRTVDPRNLTIPTRAQLAREIGKDKDGKPILAWACEHYDDEIREDGIYVTVFYSDRSEHTIRIEHVRDSHIPLVTKSQVDRHYGGVFPPKEQDNAD